MLGLRFTSPTPTVFKWTRIWVTERKLQRTVIVSESILWLWNPSVFWPVSFCLLLVDSGFLFAYAYHSPNRVSSIESMFFDHGGNHDES